MSPIRTADSAPADLRVEVNPYVPPGSVTFRAAESAWYDEILEGLDALSAADKVKTSTQAPACDRCGKPMEADGPGRWRRLHLGEV